MDRTEREFERAQAAADKAAASISAQIAKFLDRRSDVVLRDTLKIMLLQSLLCDHDDLIDLVRDLEGPTSVTLTNALLDWRDSRPERLFPWLFP